MGLGEDAGSAYLLYEWDRTSPTAPPKVAGVALTQEDAKQWVAANRDEYVSRSFNPQTIVTK